MIQLELYQLNNLCMKFSMLGAANYVKLLEERKMHISPKSDRISQREAFAVFGKPRVERWISDGLLSVQRNVGAKNAKKNHSYADLLSLDAAESRDMRALLSAKVETSKGDLTRFLAADLFKEADEVKVTQSERRAHPDGGEAEHTVTAVIDGESYTVTARSAGRCLIDIADAFRRAKEAATSKAKRHEK
jgi:hypothetical protein